VSEDHLILIPTDPYWQPGRDAADRAAAALAALLPDDRIGGAVEVCRCDTVAVVDCGANLERISCPRCGAGIAVGWWAEAVSERADGDFSTLDVTVPCCGARTSLDELAYDWPMGFARFRIEVVEPGRGWLTGPELASVADALGHPVRQVHRHL
jgi:hypothetical protein